MVTASTYVWHPMTDIWLTAHQRPGIGIDRPV